jgi:hypothetical protein
MHEVCAVNDSRAREVMINSLMQPGVGNSQWVMHTQKNIQAVGQL